MISIFKPFLIQSHPKPCLTKSRYKNLWRSLLFTGFITSAATVLSAALPPHKPGAGVSVASPQNLQLEAGVAKATSIHFQKMNRSAQITVALHSSQGLTISSPSQGPWTFSAGDSIEVPLTISAAEDGQFPLMFQVSRSLPNGKNISSITGLVVQVGEKIEKQKAASSGGIRELPAEETISQ